MSDAARMLRSCAATEWRALVVAAISTLAVVVSYLARPLPLALAVDQILDRGVPFELTAGDWRVLLALAGLVLLIVLLNTLGGNVADDRLERASERIVHRLRVRTYSRLQRLSLAFHERQRTGNLVTHVNGDVNAVGSFFADSVGGVASAGMVLLGMLAVSLVVDPLMAVTAFAAAPALAFISFRFQPRVRALAKRRRSVAGEIASLSDESLSSIRAVKSLGGESFEEERLERKSEELQNVSRESSRLEGRMSILIDSLGGVALALVVVVGVLRAAAGAITIGELIVLYTYARRIDRPLRTLARTTARASRSLARAERIAEILASDEIVEDRPGAFRGGRARGEIELRDVEFSYDPERPAITGLSLHVPAGQKLAVVGASGAGKSTLAALMTRLYDPVQGQVLIDGRDARDCSSAWLRDQFGLVLQETILFTGTVTENIAYGVEADREAVVAAARAAGADDFIAELPAGYDTMLGPQAVALSGGQRQRIAIARTLLRDPAVLILDEPTMGLDAASEAAVMSGLEELTRGRTTILITHSSRLAATAERVVAIEGGVISADGPPGEVLPELHHAREAVAGAPSGRLPVAADPALPRMRELLDPEVMADVLARSLADGAGRPEVLVHYVRYKPGSALVVHYQVGLDARWHDATAMIARADLGRRAQKPQNLALADLVDGRSPAPDPLFYEDSLGALIQWLPLDLSLWGLAVPPEQLDRRLRAAGLSLVEHGEEPSLLAYKPRRRAALQLDRHVLKYYSDRASFGQALAGLRIASAAQSVRTPEFEASLPEMLLTVQTLVGGGPFPSPTVVAAEAGELLRRLHRTGADGLPGFPPSAQLDAAAASARFLACIAPELEPRLHDLVARLEDTAPGPLAPVACHGDFNARQLIRNPQGLVLTDFDSMCGAPAALDHAAYFADLVRGDPTDLDRGLGALHTLLDGYGERPPGLWWHLAVMVLRRARRPFRYQDERWPERVDEMVAAAERVCP